MRTANPAMQTFVKPQTWSDAHGATRPATMTIGGTVRATAILTAICATVAVFMWQTLQSGHGLQAAYPWLIGSMLGTLVFGLVISFVPRTAPFLSPLYAVGEGVFVGAVSFAVPLMFKIKDGEGLVIQAVLLTFGILAAMLAGYSTGLLRMGSTAVKVVTVATAGIAVYYVAVLLLNLVFGMNIMSLGWQTGPIGIGFSLFVVVIASLNLVMDFQFIEAGVMNKAPKHMEWYGAYGLLVTLVWLYIETLRLLAKLQSRD
jgi:uncharacterized YccA/Bax inhibitor family protein